FANWRSPLNYQQGTLYVRVEVLEKPDTVTVTSLLCRICSGPHHDRTQNRRFGIGRVTFRKPGIYYHQLKVAEGKPLTEPDHFQWDAPITLLQIVCADPQGQMVSQWESDLGTFAGSKGAYFPLKARYTAFLLPKGSPFTPPAFW
ncbi:MAG TPA: hypothetical protein VF646_02840, partial [Cytophagales bacterium]